LLLEALIRKRLRKFPTAAAQELAQHQEANHQDDPEATDTAPRAAG
jgi:hypothetical protein